MAPGKPVLDFNAMINADRQRRKGEALAQEIFGKNRRASAPGQANINNRKPGTGGSLASRVGIVKRTVSTATKPARASPKPSAGNVDAEWTHDLHSLNNPSSARSSQTAPRGPRTQRNNRTERLQSALNGSASSPALHTQFNIVGSAKSTAEMTIRGLAGPYLVVAKNLAAGTTAADIESAMTPVGGVVLSCIIIAERPRVIAELVFETKEGADNVVDTFNNQNADGNILHVYHKSGPISSSHKLRTTQAPSTSAIRSVTPLGPRGDASRSEDNRSGYGGPDRYAPRDRSRDRRRDYDRDDIMDGSYGFEDKMETDDYDDKGPGRGLYSDNLIGNNRARGRGDSRERGRNYNNDRNRGYR